MPGLVSAVRNSGPAFEGLGSMLSKIGTGIGDLFQIISTHSDEAGQVFSSLGDIIGNREVFALEVRGDSMRDEHIVNGDYVLVERTSTAREGEIIVALIDGADATLKRFYREGAMIRLQPSNKDMAPIYAPAVTVNIQGKVLGVLRKYA